MNYLLHSACQVLGYRETPMKSTHCEWSDAELTNLKVKTPRAKYIFLGQACAAAQRNSEQTQGLTGKPLAI